MTGSDAAGPAGRDPYGQEAASVRARKAEYARTVFVLARGGAAHEMAIEPRTRELGIVTAFNPGRLLSAEENALRHARLVAEVETRGLRHGELDGASPCLTHQERSLLIEAPSAVVEELGRLFEQEAVFVIRGGELDLVYLAAPHRTLALGPFEARLRIVSEAPESRRA